MYTTTHPLPEDQRPQAEALAELHEATLVIDNPAQSNPHLPSEFIRSLDPQTATWYVPDGQKEYLGAALADIGYVGLVWVPVDETADYVAQTAHLFPDIVIGPYIITRDDTQAGATPETLFIPPNQAFGSGEHATTSGCLLAFRYLLDNGHTYTHGLDFGAGSAILALAAARTLGIPVVCADNEEPAVRIALENAASNGLANHLASFHADTPAHPAVMAQAPYPLVFANILLGPLVTLAAPLVAVLADGGHIILSGFTVEQEPDIEASYASLTPAWRHEHGGWVTRVFTK